MSAANDRGPLPPARVGLIAVFVTALVTAQLTAAKVLAFDVPVSLPVAGDTLILPGAALAIAVTFFASDCYAELYGRRAAQTVVNVAFLMNFVLLALVWSTILAPASPAGVDPAAFRTVLGASTSIVLASMASYLVSQNWDVIAFHAIRERTGGDHLWLRNLGSTATSQALDTVIFVTLGFSVVPSVLGTGTVLSASALASLMVGQYALKLLLAVLDTPVVYAVVGLLGDREGARAVPAD